MTPSQKFDFVAKSTVIMGEKANKGIEAELAKTSHQMNRITGYMLDGTKVVVAQRSGRGGMDFNKLLGGKVFAVAADATSKVLEGPKGNKQEQKHEDGVPLYSSSGFYSLSSKEYPALDVFEAYTLLNAAGDNVLVITEQQASARKTLLLASEFELDVFALELETLLDDSQNLVAKYDESANKKRKVMIAQATLAAESNDEVYSGVAFAELSHSVKDGNAFVVLHARFKSGEVLQHNLKREKIELDAKGRAISQQLLPSEAIEQWQQNVFYTALVDALNRNEDVQLSYIQGHSLRTSVSFRKKIENTINSPSPYGDAVYINGAQKGWTKAIVALLQSLHPNFPAEDYSSHHYVAMCRQAEVGLNKDKQTNTFLSPCSIQYALF